MHVGRASCVVESQSKIADTRHPLIAETIDSRVTSSLEGWRCA